MQLDISFNRKLSWSAVAVKCPNLEKLNISGLRYVTDIARHVVKMRFLEILICNRINMLEAIQQLKKILDGSKSIKVLVFSPIRSLASEFPWPSSALSRNFRQVKSYKSLGTAAHDTEKEKRIPAEIRFIKKREFLN